MTFTPSGAVALDSLGTGGPTDNSFSPIVVDTNGTSSYPAYPAPGSPTTEYPAAQITYGEVDTYAR